LRTSNRLKGFVVSGEPTEIALAVDATGVMAKLVGHLGEVDQAGLTDWALIGGLAVMVRLEGAHRPTRDIDTLSRQVDPEPKVTLLAIAESETPTGVLLPDGTKVDVVGVDPILDLDVLPGDDHQRMFVLSHWWMAETAELVTLTLFDRIESGGGVLARCQLRLARPAALVAAKLQSIETRRGAMAGKRESDAYDVYRLLRANRVDEIAEELASAPSDLGTWCVSHLEDLFVDRADRTARWLRNVSPGEVVEAGDVSALGVLFVEAYQSLG
jgi:predicted transcriptional regulator